MAYMCVKCGLEWYNRPLAGACPRGGNHRVVVENHEPGRHWRCSKCGIMAGGSRHPLVTQGSCRGGGWHSWRKA